MRVSTKLMLAGTVIVLVTLLVGHWYPVAYYVGSMLSLISLGLGIGERLISNN